MVTSGTQCTAPAALATYVKNVIGAASGSTMSTMLRAQALATLLSAYFGDPATAGGVRAAQILPNPNDRPYMSFDTDLMLSIACKPPGMGGAFVLNGVTPDHLPVSGMLDRVTRNFCNCTSNFFYNNDKVNQEKAKNMFDAINNDCVPLAPASCP